MNKALEWIKNFFTGIWNDFVEFITEIPILILDGFLGAIATIFEAIPVPSFIQNGLGSYIANIDSGVLYLLSQSGITQAFALLGAGLSFRLLRKLFTLGQW